MRSGDMSARKFLAFLEGMCHNGTAGGLLLLLCAAVAVVAANVPALSGLHMIWDKEVSVPAGGFSFGMSLRAWVNDVLMAVFFLSVGLEIKRELMTGELSTFRKAVLPMFAALGGMLFPALIYTAFNAGTPSAGGWGIPMATDIAFAIGVLSLLGRRCPAGLKILLVALAVVDDIGAIIVLALFYPSHDIHAVYLLLALLATGGLVLFNKTKVNSAVPYILLGAVLFVFVFKSGIHATIAGVVLAMTIPAGKQSPESGASCGRASLLDRMDAALHPWVVFLIMPVFALANAGVVIDPSAIGHGTGIPAVMPGVFFGLLAGKPLGIFLFSWAAVKTGLAVLPEGTRWRQLFSLSILGGIGFTMSIFINNLAFTDLFMVNAGKLAILAASFMAACLGVAALYLTTDKPIKQNKK